MIKVVSIDTTNVEYDMVKFSTCGTSFEEKANVRVTSKPFRKGHSFEVGNTFSNKTIIVESADVPFWEGQQAFEKTGLYYRHSIINI